METRTYTREQILTGNLDQVFAFFADATHLEFITPPWLRFQTISALPAQMEQGVTMEHKLKLHRIPVRWVTEISEWSPPYKFVDRQKVGPFSTWIHSHEFVPVPTGTLMTDTVVYRVPGWLLGRLIDWLYVSRDIRRIFEYRQQAIAKLLERNQETLEQFSNLDGLRQ